MLALRYLIFFINTVFVTYNLVVSDLLHGYEKGFGTLTGYSFNLNINIRQRGYEIITAQVVEQETSQYENSNELVLCDGVRLGRAGRVRRPGY